MTEIVYTRQTSTLSSGFVGTIVCWTFGVCVAGLGIVVAFNGSLVCRLAGLMVLGTGAIVCGWAQSASAEWKLRLSAFLIAGLITTGVAEVGLRTFTSLPRPRNAATIPHPDLGAVLSPDVDGVDENGFRNESVLETPDVVAIGDQLTQGWQEPLNQTWPVVFGTQTKQSVYTMAVTGYGPVQYETLVNRALALKPRQIVIGLSLKDDFTVVQTEEHENDGRTDAGFRHHLTDRSAVGNLVSNWFRQKVQSAETSTFAPRLDLSELNSRQQAIDLSSPHVHAGIARSVEIIARADQQCRKARVALTVLLLPDPHTVLWLSTSEDPNSESVRGLKVTERRFAAAATQQLQSANVFVIDAHEALSAEFAKPKTDDAGRTFNKVYLAGCAAALVAPTGNPAHGVSTN